MTRRDYCYICNSMVSDDAPCCNTCGQSVCNECTPNTFEKYLEDNSFSADSDDYDDFIDNYYENFQCKRCQDEEELERKLKSEIEELKRENNKLRSLIFSNHFDKNLIKKIYDFL